MAVPLVPILRLSIQLAAMAAASYAAKRAFSANFQTGRTDQRAEDMFDDLDEGFAVHAPTDRAPESGRQANAAARVNRIIRWGKRGLEIDAALLGRFRIRRVKTG